MYKVNYYSEICCELCNEVIHNHFDCPVCGIKNAGTSIYSSIEEAIYLNDLIFECERCNTEFEIIKITLTDKLKIKLVGA